MQNSGAAGCNGVKSEHSKSVDVFLLSSQCSSVVEFKPSDAAWIKIDPFELELLVLNLLRNANEALVKTANARIEVNVSINKKLLRCFNRQKQRSQTFGRSIDKN